MRTTRKRTIGARVLMGALAAGVLVVAGTGPVAAQGVPTDARWQAWLGCWEPTEVSALTGTPGAPVMCFIPDAGGAAVDLVAVSAGRILMRHRIDAMGDRLSVTIGDCTGWERAEWSAEGARIYVRSETECPGTGRRVSSRVLAKASPTSWLDVETVVLADSSQGARVRRYLEAAEVPAEPAEIRAALAGLTDQRAARVAAAAALSMSEVIEASHRLDSTVLVAWLAALHRPFQLNGRALLALSDSGVPGPVVDVMVALSYDRRFAVAETEALPPDLYRRNTYVMDPYGLYHPGYFGDRPGAYFLRQSGVLIVDRSTAAPIHGRVVNGSGYVDARAGTGPSATVSSGSSGGGSMSPSGASGGSGTSTERTAHPRP